VLVADAGSSGWPFSSNSLGDDVLSSLVAGNCTVIASFAGGSVFGMTRGCTSTPFAGVRTSDGGSLGC